MNIKKFKTLEELEVSPIHLDNFLDLLINSDQRYEYCAGRVYAMVGGTTTHSLLTLEMAVHLRLAVKGHNLSSDE